MLRCCVQEVNGSAQFVEGAGEIVETPDHSRPANMETEPILPASHGGLSLLQNLLLFGIVVGAIGIFLKTRRII